MESSFKTVNTHLLEVAYLEYGATDGKPVVLLHGWPHCTNTWSKVARVLAEKGWRVFAPALQVCGETRFLDEGTI